MHNDYSQTYLKTLTSTNMYDARTPLTGPFNLKYQTMIKGNLLDEFNINKA